MPEQDVPLAQTHQLELAPVPESVPEARRLLTEVMCGSPLAHRLDDAALAVTELVTNAVLHGREPIVLTVARDGVRLHVSVCDGSPVSPSFSMLDPTAITGRGLMLISAATDRWGVEPRPDGKSVWFDVHLQTAQGEQEQVDVDALLAAWGDELSVDPAAEQVRIVLTDVDVPLAARSEAHVEGLLRELTLLVGDEAAPVQQRRTARRVLQAAADLDAVRAELRRQLAVAVAGSAARIDVTLCIVRGDAEAVRDFAHAVDEADRLSRNGELLAAPAPLELTHARRVYLRRILSQLSS
ncbi:MAG: ATP-binding protein [Actinomycetota bacterium]|nr:ATP-binding protein [Actinomycetota bacterium]